MPAHALTELHQRMLYVTRMLFVMQIFADLLVGKLAPKPRVPPEQQRHEHD
jgi:hypothetical protein